MNSETINLVNATYAQTGASAKTDKLGSTRRSPSLPEVRPPLPTS